MKDNLVGLFHIDFVQDINGIKKIFKIGLENIFNICYPNMNFLIIIKIFLN